MVWCRFEFSGLAGGDNMIIVSINWPISGIIYYTIGISQMYGVIQTEKYLLSVGEITRAVSQGQGIENSNVTVKFNDLDGYFSSKLVSTDQYIKGRALSVIDYNEITLISTTLFTGFISEMGFISDGVFTLNADILTSMFDAEINQNVLTSTEFPSMPVEFLGNKKAFLFGSAARPDLTHIYNPRFGDEWSLVGYYTGASNRYFLLEYIPLFTVDGLGVWSQVAGVWHNIKLDCTFEVVGNNFFITYAGAFPPDDGRIYASGADYGVALNAADPATMLAAILLARLGITLDGVAAAKTIFNSWGWGHDASAATYVFSDNTTWREFFQRMMDMFDCLIFLEPSGHLAIKACDYTNKTSLGTIPVDVDDNLEYKLDYTQLTKSVYRQYNYAYVGQYFRNFPNDVTTGKTWGPLGEVRYLDQRYIGGYQSDSLSSAIRYVSRYANPTIWIDIDVARDYYFGSTQAIALDIGNIVTLNHPLYRLHPSTGRQVMITKINIKSDGLTVGIEGYDITDILDTNGLIRLIHEDANFVANGGCVLYADTHPSVAHLITL